MIGGNDITYRVERGIKEFVDFFIADNNIVASTYHGIEKQDEEKQLPHVVIACQSASADDTDGILWNARLTVEVRTNSDDTSPEEHHELAEAIINAITDGDAELWVNAHSELLHVYGVNIETQEWSARDRSWVSGCVCNVVCIGSQTEE